MMMAQSRLEANKVFLRDLLLSRKFSQQRLLSREDPVGTHVEPNRKSHLSPPSTRLESRWQRYCLNTIPAGETPLETLSRLNNVVYGWLRPEERTKEQIIDKIVLEKFMALLPVDMQSWVKARRPGNSKEAAELVDALLQQQESKDSIKLPVMKVEDQLASLTKSECGLMDPKQNTLYWEVVEEEEENGTSKVLRVLNNDTPQTKASSITQSEREKLESIQHGSMCPVSTCALSNPDIIIVEIKEGEDFCQEDPTKEGNGIVSQYTKQDDNYKNWPCWPQGRIWQEEHPRKKEETSGRSLKKKHHSKIYPKTEQEMYPPPASLVETAKPRASETSFYKQHECERCLGLSCNITGCTEIFTELKPNCSAFLTHGASTKQKKSYPCKDCGKNLSSKSAIINHQMIHTDKKPHDCYECGKRFRYRSALAVHQKIHTGEKPHQCRYCGKSFRVKSSLTIHQRIHTGDKPFPCPVCGRKFNQRSKLVYHSRTHTGEQPYQCSACNKRFRLRSSLVKHERVHSRGDCKGDLQVEWSSN